MTYALQIPSYTTHAECCAYNDGYNDGYDCKPRANHAYPNAYSKGYWDGFADSPFKGAIATASDSEHTQWLRELHGHAKPLPLFKWAFWAFAIALMAFGLYVLYALKGA